MACRDEPAARQSVDVAVLKTNRDSARERAGMRASSDIPRPAENRFSCMCSGFMVLDYRFHNDMACL